jgi:hypothetical protein
LDGNLFSNFIGSRRTKRPLVGAKDFKAFIGQGKQVQGRSWRLTKKEDFFVCMGRRKKKMMKCEEGFVVLMCGEVFMEKVCARIKHGRKLCCNKYL